MPVLEGNEDAAGQRAQDRIEPSWMRRPQTGKLGDVAIPGAVSQQTPFQGDVPAFNVPGSQGAFGLAEFMAAIRRLESGSYEGDYGAVGRRVKGDNARGAYQIMSKNWPSWSASAGIPGADWRNRAAQDRVAAHMMNKLYEQFRDWDLVAVAWYSGGSNARTLQRRGWSGNSGSIQNKHIRGYVNKIRGFYPEARQYAAGQPGGAPQAFYASSNQRSTGGMLFPLPGSENRWVDTWGADRAGGARKHKGADIGGKQGAPLIAVTSGTAYSGYNSTAGNYVYLVDEGNNFRYFYAHLDKKYVPTGSSNGVRVGAGQQIGTVGATGNAGGPHLHFGVYDLKRGYINPTSWLQAARSGGSAFAPPPSGNMGAEGQPPGPYDPNAVPGQSGGISYEGMMRNFFEQYGNSLAGGQRVDPRTIGLQEEQTRGAAETLIGEDREGAATAAAGALEVAPVSRETELLSTADDEGVTV